VTAVRSVVCALILAIGLPAQAADCEAVIGKYMVGQALLAANYVAAAEKAGMKPAEINAALKDVAARSSIEEFWITDSSGRAISQRPASTSPSTAIPPSSRKPRPSGR
jgi:hypothetical protein